MAKPASPHSPAKPKPVANALMRPFVGNTSIDDNLQECIQLAAWEAVGPSARGIVVYVANRAAVLSGRLPSEDERRMVLSAVREIDGISSVVDRITIDLDEEEAATRSVLDPQPFIYVVRHCGEEDSSTAAAIRDAISRLDAFLAENGAIAPDELIVIYRMKVPRTLTLEVGFAVPVEVADNATGEIHRGITPAGTMVSLMPGPKMAGVIAATRNLGGAATSDYVWQRFPASLFRPWRGHRPAQVLAPIRHPAAKTAQ